MQYNTPEDVLDYIKSLEERVKKLEKLTRAGVTSIDDGALTIKKLGQVIAAFGDLAQAGFTNVSRPDGTAQMGVLLYTDDGKLAFSLWDGSPTPIYQQYWAFWDRGQRIIFSSDGDSGWGLATPQIPGPIWFNTDTTHWPTTVSSSFSTAWDSYLVVQQPKLAVNFLLYCDNAATTGEARLMIEGAQYGPTISMTGVGYASFDQLLTLPQSMQQVNYSHMWIEYRRVSGTGNIKAAPRITMGRQT